MFEFVIQHQFWTAVVIYWIFSAAVSSTPNPAANGNAAYLWLCRPAQYRPPIDFHLKASPQST